LDEIKDFFISYAKNDEQQALWINKILTKAGYTTIIQACDFKAGDTFTGSMHKALQNSERLIAVLSDDYFKSAMCNKEWESAFYNYRDIDRAIIPVRISNVELTGLFRTIIYIDLYNAKENEWEKVLITGIEGKNIKNIPIGPGKKWHGKKGDLPLNNLPHSKNPYFTGRDEKLELIYTNFKNGDAISFVQSISGLGGVGKSSLALEYAYNHSHEYADAVWWVNAENYTTAIAAYRDFALRKEIIKQEAKADEVIEAMQYWFNGKKSWLFIFDNADSDDFNKWLEPFLPKTNTGHVLITTRSSFFPKSISINLNVFNETESVTFLKKRAGKSGDAYSDDSDKTLAERLQYLPLALEQAAAYIAETPNVTYKDYLGLIDKYGVDTFQKKTPDGKEYYLVDYSMIITTTWKISMEKIKQESAIQMFNMCAYFAPEKIPVEVFTRGIDVLPSPLHENITDLRERKAILSDLTRYSLLSWGRDSNTSTDETTVLYMHRLLQEVVQKSFGDNSNWLAYCLDLICNAVDWIGIDGLKLKKAFELESPHTIRIADKSYEIFERNNEKLEKVVKIYLYNSAVNADLLFIDAGLSYIEKCIQILERLCIEENSIDVKNYLLSSYLTKGNIFYSLLKYPKVVEFLNKSIQLGEQLKKNKELNDEFLLAHAYRNRGSAYECMKLHAEALTDMNISIDRYKCLYSAGLLCDENELAIAYMNRAIIYQSMAKYDESLLDANKAKGILEKIKEEEKAVYENTMAKVISTISITNSKIAFEKNKKDLSNTGLEKYNHNTLNSNLNYWKKQRNKG